MGDGNRTRAQLLEELEALQGRVDELERADEDRRLVEEGLASIIRLVPDVVYRLDAEGRITFVSEAVRSYGYDPAELIGQFILELIHPDDREAATFRVNERRSRRPFPRPTRNGPAAWSCGGCGATASIAAE